MDKIHIRDLQLSCIIGELPSERRKKQRITLNIVYGYDASKAAESDDLSDAPDYSRIEREICEEIEQSSFRLQEALANAVVKICFRHPGIRYAKVTIDKPLAAARARSIAFEMERFR